MINTRVLLTDFEYFEPKTIEEAVPLLGKYEGEARVLAGGTDLLIDIKRKRIEPKYLINIKKIRDLDYIREDKGLQIGAATSICRIEKNQLVKNGYLALFEAARAFGTVQIRNMATIGGNICNGLPSADIPPALVAFDAKVRIVGPMGERFLPLREFFMGIRKTALKNDELLTEIRVPSPPAHSGTAFLKVGRTAEDLAIVNVAVRITLGTDKTCKEARVVIGGGVGPTLIRSEKVEALLEGKKIGDALIDEVAQIAPEKLRPRPTSIRGSPFYKREVCSILVKRALKKSLDEIRGVR